MSSFDLPYEIANVEFRPQFLYEFCILTWNLKYVEFRPPIFTNVAFRPYTIIVSTPVFFPTTCPLYINISFDPPPPISSAFWPMYSFDTCFSTKAYDVETPPEYTPTPNPHREQP